jgi:UDP-2,4-diacetamido-2,4,6-trideoxy-beta-L-altropyranose hydrolase
MIAIRTEGGAQTGEGHIVRTLAIAQAVRDMGGDAVFITGGGYEERIVSAGFEHRVINDADLPQEAETLRVLLRELGTVTLLVDSYNVTPKYFKALNSFVQTAYIDDFGQDAYPAALVICPHIFCDAVQLAKPYTGAHTRFLTGPRYMPLRQQFAHIPPSPVRKHIRDLLITTGSTDAHYMSLRLTEAFAADGFFEGVRLHIAAGKYYTHTNALLALEKSTPNITVYENLPDLKVLMLPCDIAVSAGGGTLYELCACGLPGVIFGLADNQKKIRESFGKAGVMIDCGDCRTNATIVTDIVQAVKGLQSARLRAKLRQKERAVTDGRGAERIAQALLLL